METEDREGTLYDVNGWTGEIDRLSMDYQEQDPDDFKDWEKGLPMAQDREAVLAQIDPLLRWLINEEYREKDIRSEIDRLKRKEQSAKNRQEWIRKKLCEFMRSAAVVSHKTPLRTVSLMVNKPRIVIENGLVPEDRWPVTALAACCEQESYYKINRDKLGEYLAETGDELPGISYTEPTYFVSIR